MVKIPSMTEASRNWLFTCNKYGDEDIGMLARFGSDKGVQYLVYGKEKAPTTGHEHLQGFIIFKHVRRFNGVKRFFSKLSHADLRMGDGKAVKMMEYCKKDGVFVEFGRAPIPAKVSGAIGGKSKGINYRKVIKLAEAGDYDKLKAKYPKQWLSYHRTLKTIHKDHGKMPAHLEEVCGVWIYGPAGSGKSYFAREEYPEGYDKPCNKWFDNYQGEDNILLDDFDVKHAVLAHHLKRWADRYAFSGETKGSQINLRPKKVIVTSQYRINEIWSDKETQEALNRRFIKIKIHIDSQGNRVIQNQGF